MKTVRSTTLTILFAWLLASAFSCGGAADQPPVETHDPETTDNGQEAVYDLEELNMTWASYASQQRNRELIDMARPVYRQALLRGETKTAVYAGAYIGQAFGMLFKPDSMYYYFDEITGPAREGDYDFPLMVIYNTIGVHNLMYAMNYDEALHCFYEALAAK